MVDLVRVYPKPETLNPKPLWLTLPEFTISPQPKTLCSGHPRQVKLAKLVEVLRIQLSMEALERVTLNPEPLKLKPKTPEPLNS